MSTIVVVRKAGVACIACDTLAAVGSAKQKSHYSEAPSKIFQFRDTLIGTVGYAVHNAVLQSYLSRYPDNVKLDTAADIFETWRVMHNILREEYHMNPRAETDDAYETTRMSASARQPAWHLRRHTFARCGAVPAFLGDWLGRSACTGRDVHPVRAVRGRRRDRPRRRGGGGGIRR